MRPLRPTRRGKKRYIYVEFLKGKPSNPVLWARKKVKEVFGAWGLSFVKKVERWEDGVMLTVSREWADLVAASLVLGKETFVPRTYISGTVKSLRRKVL